MKFLYLTDTHIRGRRPWTRKDNFAATLASKLQEVVELANDYGVTAVLHGGDFFDLPAPALPTVGQFAAILRQLRAPLYVVPGNHDIYGYDPASLEHTMLGFLARLGLLHLLVPEVKRYFRRRNLTVQVTGQPFHYAIDCRDPQKDYCVAKTGCDLAIHLVHGMLVPKPFYSGAPYTLIEQVAPYTQADYTLASHAHFGFPEVFYQGKWFINPGSLARLSPHPKDIERFPQVVLLDFSGPVPRHSYIRLQSARPGHEVIDTGAFEANLRRQARLREHLARIHQEGPASLQDLLDALAAKKKVPGHVHTEARKRLHKAHRLEKRLR